MLGDVRCPDRLALVDDQPEEAVAARQRPDLRPMLGADAGRDEALDLAAGRGDPEGRVLGVHEDPDAIHDELERRLEVADLGDGAGRLIEGFEGVRREGLARDGAVGRHVARD